MATVMDARVVMLFRHHAQAQRAIDALLDAGFGRDAITLSEPDVDVLRQIEIDEVAEAEPPPIASATPMFAGVGALVGAVVGGLIGWLARPFGRARLWNAAGGAVVGSAIGSGAAAYAAQRWMPPADGSAGEPQTGTELEPIQYDEGSLGRGRAMVTVDPGARAAECEEILLSFGGRRPGHPAPNPRPRPADVPTQPDDATTVFPTLDEGAPAEAAVADEALAGGRVAGDPLEAEVAERREDLGAFNPGVRDRL